MSKRNKTNPNPIYTVRKQFDLEHITEYLIEAVKDGEMTWKEAIEDAAMTAAADVWFEDRFDSKDLIGREFDMETGVVGYDMQEDGQLY